MREQRFGNLKVQMGARGMTRQSAGQRGVDIVGKCCAIARIDKQRFRGDALGIDDLMFVKENLEVVHETAILLNDGGSVYQVTRPHEKFVPPRTKGIRALVDKEPVIGADMQVIRIVERASADADR